MILLAGPLFKVYTYLPRRALWLGGHSGTNTYVLFISREWYLFRIASCYFFILELFLIALLYVFGL